MTESLLWAAGSAGALFVLVTLFHIESIKGDRIILGGVRRWLDGFVLWAGHHLHNVLRHFGTGTLRVILHYGLNSLLLALRAVVRKFEDYLTRVARRNRRIARSIQAEKADEHLRAMVEHKKATELTEREKAKLKKVMLEG